MAETVYKEIKTRIALKTLPLLGENSWDSIKDTYKPLKGEVCICEIPQGNANATTAPTILFKVGDGTSTWNQLKWASALAADVYDWAKQSSLPVVRDSSETGEAGNVISSISFKDGNVVYTTASVATSEGMKDLQEAVAAIEKDIDDNRDAWALDTDTHYAFELVTADGNNKGKIQVTATTYTNGKAGAPVYSYFDVLTNDEVNLILESYYTKSEIDTKLGDYALKSELHAPTTVTQGDGIVVNGADRNYTVSHADTSSVANLTANGRTYVTGLTFDEFGHVTAFATGTETDQEIPEETALSITDKTATDTEDLVYAVSNLVEGGTKGHAVTATYSALPTQKYVDDAIAEAIDAIPDVVHPEYSIIKDATSEYAATYHLTKDGVNIGAAINIPKDLVVESGEVKTLEAGSPWGDAGTYIILTLANATNDKIYVNVGDLIEYVTSGSTADSQVIVTVDDNHKVTATIGAGKVTATELAKAVTDDIAKGVTAHGWGDHSQAGYAKTADLGDLATKDDITHDLVTDFDTAVAAVKVSEAEHADAATNAENASHAVAADEATHADGADFATNAGHAGSADEATHAASADNATKAADADKLGGQLPSYYATAEALNTVSGVANDAKTHASTNAGLIQGNTNRIQALENANHISEVTTTENGGLKVTNKNQIDIDDEVVFVLNCNW